MRVLLVAALAAVTITTVGAAQTPRTENISAVETFAEPFSSLGNMRALDNGNLLVTDRVEKAVYKINFGTGSYDMIGLNGQGPQEYDMPTGVFPLGERVPTRRTRGPGRKSPEGWRWHLRAASVGTDPDSAP